MNPKHLSIDDFQYLLPEERIAKYPLDKRDSSKLLSYKNGNITDHHFWELPELLNSDSLIIANNTRVIQARVLFKKESGTKIEIFCLEPFQISHEQAFQSRQKCTWICMVGNAKRWKSEILTKEVLCSGLPVLLHAKLIERNDDHFKVEFSWEKGISFGELLTFAGILPIPPYLNRDTEEKDKEVYQTTYAKADGSVAAPTAGLHFTKEVIASLESKNIQFAEITLHVGAGTFRPVKAARMEDHEMHRESVYVELDTIKQILLKLREGDPIIAVGTTTLRSLESLYWFGVKLLLNPSNLLFLEVNQWDPYELPQHYTAIEALEAVLARTEKENLNAISGNTQLLIAPGYQIKMVDALVTNFHQPGSTLLLLVAAFVGENWVNIYNHALINDYRFLSYGDSSLLFRQTK